MGIKNSEAPKAATFGASDLPVNYEKTDMNSLAINNSVCTGSLIISGIEIHNDSEGRYSLNDLHNAAGGERRHEPANWLALQQTTELVNEILNTGNPVFKPMTSKRGRYGGTYVCKELIYSYAMWISAAFSLKVIRAYDALVTQFHTVKPQKKALPGKITAEQQEAIKQLVLTRGKSVPKEHQAKATIAMWSALKTHFGCTYKEINEDQFVEALSLAARIPIEGELLPRTEVIVATPQHDAELLALAEDAFSLIKEMDFAFELLGAAATRAEGRLFWSLMAMRKHVTTIAHGMVRKAGFPG